MKKDGSRELIRAKWWVNEERWKLRIHKSQVVSQWRKTEADNSQEQNDESVKKDARQKITRSKWWVNEENGRRELSSWNEEWPIRRPFSLSKQRPLSNRIPLNLSETLDESHAASRRYILLSPILNLVCLYIGYSSYVPLRISFRLLINLVSCLNYCPRVCVSLSVCRGVLLIPFLLF